MREVYGAEEEERNATERGGEVAVEEEERRWRAASSRGRRVREGGSERKASQERGFEIGERATAVCGRAAADGALAEWNG